MNETDLPERLDSLDKAVFGDRDNPKGQPGIIADQARLGAELTRTNEILTELRNSVLWINRLLVGGFVTALLAIVFKNVP
jgi:hypothetical protein